MRQKRYRPGLAARCALLALLFSLFAAPAWAGGAALAVPDIAAPGFIVEAANALPAITAMGGRDESALAPRGGGDESAAEQMFGGSYLGALFFGYPATGFGGADLIALAVLAYLLLRSFGGRKAADKDRFTVHRGGLDRDGDEADNDAPRRSPGNGRADGPRREPGSESEDGLGGWRRERPNEGQESGSRDEWFGGRQERPGDRTGDRRDAASSGNPRDNAWSRKLRGGTPSGKPNPWGGASPDKESPWNGSRSGGDDGRERPRVTVRDRAEAMWGHLSSEQPAREDTSPAGAIAEGARVPAGFDVNDFLDGARTLYVRLQNAWASRKVDDLAPFVADDLMNLLRGQAAANPEPSVVDIILVNATLQDVRGDDADQKALVHFNVLMKTGGETQPSEVNEIWTFARDGASGGMWRLTGIEAA